MCWHSGILPVRHTADRDIPVYKIAYRLSDDSIMSINNFIEYKLNHLYQTDEPLIYETTDGKTYIIKNPLMFSYSDEQTYIEHFSTNNGFMVMNNNTAQSIRPYPRQAIPVKLYGYIPEQANYYINERGEIISDKLILNNTSNIFKHNSKYVNRQKKKNNKHKWNKYTSYNI